MEEKQESKIFTCTYKGRDPRGLTEKDLKELQQIREKYTPQLKIKLTDKL